MSEKPTEAPKKRGRPAGTTTTKISVATAQRTVWRLHKLKELMADTPYSQMLSVGLELMGAQIAGKLENTGLIAPMPPSELNEKNKAPLGFNIKNEDLSKIDTYATYWEASSSWVVSHAIRLVYEMAKGVWKKM